MFQGEGVENGGPKELEDGYQTRLRMDGEYGDDYDQYQYPEGKRS